MADRAECVHQLALKYSYLVHQGPDAIKNVLKSAEAEVWPASSEEGAQTSLEVSLAQQQHLSPWTRWTSQLPAR